MNNELFLVSALLANPSYSTEFALHTEWFENAALRRVVRMVNQLKGTAYTVQDVFRELKASYPFECGSLEELEMLAGNYEEQGIVQEVVRLTHKDYLDRELKKNSEVYAKTGSDKYADKIQRLLEERATLNRTKGDGKLTHAYKTFLQMLDEPNSLLRTFSELDTFLGGGLSGGQLVVIGARPAVGKTALGINMALNILDKNKHTAVDFFTLEMTDWQLTSRIISKRAKINSMLLRQPHNLVPKNREKAKEVIEDTMKLDLRIFGAEYDQINDIKHMIRKRAKDKPNQYVAFIDYAGLIKVSDSRKQERQVLNEVTRELKLLTNELQIVIVLFSQLNRGLESKQDKTPTLADLKESGSLEQDANVVLLLEKSKDRKNIVNCHVAKNREGMTGCIPFKFLPQFMDFDVDYASTR